MKKQLLFIMAGGLLAFASCNNAATENGASQAQVDSMVNVRVEQIRTEMMAKNDSMINVMAQMKADSMIAAMKSGNKPAAKAPAHGKPAQPALSQIGGSSNSGAAVAPPSNPKENRFNGQQAGTGNKDARFSNDAAKKQQDDNAKKKADRFK